MTPPTPGEPNVICHFCGCRSPHAFRCGGCGHEFCMQCIATTLPTPPQQLHCPACGSPNVRPQAEPSGEQF